MKKKFVLLVFSISTISCGQEKIKEVLVDANGKVIEVKESNQSEIILPEKTIEVFYHNLNNIKAIDSLMSFRFYQKTPFVKFKEILSQKNEACGKYLSKTLVENKLSPDGNSIKFIYKVQYEKINTIEEIILIKESKSDNFKIFFYDIKKE